MQWLVVGLSLAASHATARDLTVAFKPEYSSARLEGSLEHRHDAPIEARLAGERWAVGLRVPVSFVSERYRTSRRSAGGLGDIRVSASVTALQMPDDGPQVDIGLKFRLPTGSVARGFGTGVPQYAPTLDASLPLSTTLSLDLSLERRINAGGAGLGLRDHWYGTLDLGYAIHRDVVVGLSVVGRDAAVSGGGPVLELGPTIDFTLPEGWKLGLLAYAGVTRQSAGLGAGLTLSRRFRF